MEVGSEPITKLASKANEEQTERTTELTNFFTMGVERFPVPEGLVVCIGFVFYENDQFECYTYILNHSERQRGFYEFQKMFEDMKLRQTTEFQLALSFKRNLHKVPEYIFDDSTIQYFDEEDEKFAIEVDFDYVVSQIIQE